MKEKGVWRTIKGRHVFIKEGQSLKDALNNKYNNKEPKKNKYATNNESGADDNTSAYAQKSIDFWKEQKAKVEKDGGDASWDIANIERWEKEKANRIKGEFENTNGFETTLKEYNGQLAEGANWGSKLTAGQKVKVTGTEMKVSGDASDNYYNIVDDTGNKTYGISGKHLNNIDKASFNDKLDPKKLQKDAYDNLLIEQGKREGIKQEQNKSLQERLKDRINAEYNPNGNVQNNGNNARDRAYEEVTYLDRTSSYDDFDSTIKILEDISDDVEDKDTKSFIDDAVYELNEARDMAYDLEELRNAVDNAGTVQEAIDNITDKTGGWSNDYDYITDNAKGELKDLIKEYVGENDLENIFGWDNDPETYDTVEDAIDQFVDDNDYDELRDRWFDKDYRSKTETTNKDHFANEDIYKEFSDRFNQIDNDVWNQLRDEVDSAVEDKEFELQDYIDNATSYIESIDDDISIKENGTKVTGSRPIAEKLALQEKTKGRAIAHSSIGYIQDALNKDFIKTADQGIEYAKGQQLPADRDLKDILEVEKMVTGSNLTTMEDYLKKVNAQTNRKLGSQLMSKNEVIEMFMKKGYSREGATRMMIKYMNNRKNK